MQRRDLVFVALVVASTIGAPTAYAADAAAEPDAATEERAAEEDADEPLESVFGATVNVLGEQPQRADTVTVVGAEEIEGRHAPVAFDALDKEPGLHLRSRLGMSGAGLSRLVIRGIGHEGPAGLAVFVDGRPDSSVSFAHPTPSAHSLEAADRIEVTHGPSPVLDGAGLTGVVRIISAPPALGTHGFVQAGAGSFSTVESFLRVDHGWEGGYARVSGSYRSTDGDVPDSDALVRSGHVKAGFQLGPRWDLAIGAGRNKDHFSVFGPFFVPGPFANPGTTDLDLEQTVADVTLRGRFARWNGSLKLWYDDLDPLSQNLRPGVSRAEVTERGARLRAELFPESRTRLILGVDALQAEATNTPGLPPNSTQQDESLTEVGPYAFVEHSLTARATLLGGVRLVDHSEYGTEPVGEAGVTWRVGPAATPDGAGTLLRARYTHGYQSPTLQELFGLFLGGRGGLANPDLEPETMDQYEIGVNRTRGDWSLDVVAFLQEGDNLITQVGRSLQNSGTFSHPGVEARLDHRATPSFTWGLGVTVIDLDDTVTGVPEQTVDFGFEVAPEAWSRRDVRLTVRSRWSDGYRDQAAPAAPVTALDDYLVVDLKLLGRLTPSLLGYVEIDNLTGEDYQVVAGIPMPGLGALAGLRFDF